jgi:hypothetical protein
MYSSSLMKTFFLVLHFSLALNVHPARYCGYWLDHNDPYDAIKLSRAYYANLPEITVSDAERFERLLLALEWANRFNTNPILAKAYGKLLSGMINGRQLEGFMCLYPLVNMGDYPSEIGYLMIQCAANDRREIAEYIFATSYGSGRAKEFISELKRTLFEYAFPIYAINLVGWIVEFDAGVDGRKFEIYSFLLSGLPKNGAISRDTLMSLVRKLVSLGADVSDAVIDKYKKEYPAFDDLLRFLYESQIPDVKEPEE